MARVRHHVNPLGGPALAGRTAPLDLGSAVGDVEVELGCADARFLFERAPKLRSTLHVGLEIREPLVKQVNRMAEERGLPNLKAFFANINIDLAHLFSDGSLRRAYVNFPDPWFKRRHHKRRLMTPELAETLVAKLCPQGELFFQSDVFDLALDAMEVLEATPGLVNMTGAWSFSPSNPYGAQSLREIRCEERNTRIWRIRYLRP